MNLEFLTSISFSLHVDLILQCQALLIRLHSLYTASASFQFGVWMYTSAYCHVVIMCLLSSQFVNKMNLSPTQLSVICSSHLQYKKEANNVCTQILGFPKIS